MLIILVGYHAQRLQNNRYLNMIQPSISNILAKITLICHREKLLSVKTFANRLLMNKVSNGIQAKNKQTFCREFLRSTEKKVTEMQTIKMKFKQHSSKSFI